MILLFGVLVLMGLRQLSDELFVVCLRLSAVADVGDLRGLNEGLSLSVVRSRNLLFCFLFGSFHSLTIWNLEKCFFYLFDSKEKSHFDAYFQL